MGGSIGTVRANGTGMKSLSHLVIPTELQIEDSSTPLDYSASYEFGVVSSRRPAHIVTLDYPGARLDRSSGLRTLLTFERLIGQGADVVVLDLKSVSSVMAEGVAQLCRLEEQGRQGRLVLAAPNGVLLKLISNLGLSESFRVYASVNAAYIDHHKKIL